MQDIKQVVDWKAAPHHQPVQHPKLQGHCQDSLLVWFFEPISGGHYCKIYDYPWNYSHLAPNHVNL